MDFRRLEEFSVLAGSGSFRRAAEELGISPALLSSRINSLEKKLGVKLLERSSHSMSLTEAGKCFLTDSREISADYRQLLSRTEGVGKHIYRSIRIGMASFIIPAKLGPYLDTVNLRHPSIHIELLDDSHCGIAESLESGTLDLFFSYCPDDLEFEGVRRELVYTTRVQVLVPQSHRLASRSSVTAAELDGERFVLYPKTEVPAMRQAELGLLKKSGISFSVYEDTVCPSAYFVMVPIGKGLALCPWVLRHMIPPNTVGITVDDPGFAMNMYMFYRDDCPNPYLPRFLEGFRSFEMGGVEQ